MLDNDHRALGQKFTARQQRQDRIHFTRGVGRVHEDPAKDPTFRLGGHAVQGVQHARSDDPNPSGEPKLAQIPLQDPQRSRITFHEVRCHRTARKGLDSKRASPGKQVKHRVRRGRTQNVEDGLAHLRPSGPGGGSTWRTQLAPTVGAGSDPHGRVTYRVQGGVVNQWTARLSFCACQIPFCSLPR